ncbi:hypothetical protein BH10PSE7_BH10PSE7_44680 [soil metagenome]
MTTRKQKFDPAIIDAEEDFLAQCQFLLHDKMAELGFGRGDVAQRANISKARLSQIFGPEANPTVKTIARLFYALGIEITLCEKAKEVNCKAPAATSESWTWGSVLAAASGLGHKQQAVIVEEFRYMETNDNACSVPTIQHEENAEYELQAA